MTRRTPAAGHCVIVELTSPGGWRYVCETVVNWAGEGELLVTFPRAAQLPDLPPDAVLVRIRFADDEGMHYAEGRVAERGSGDPIKMKVALSGEVETLHRRQFLRLARELPITCTLLDEAEREQRTFSAYTLDIGGKGAGILSSEPLSVGQALRFALDLEGRGSCSGVGMVRRVVEVLGEQGRQFRVAVEFTEITPTNQALILSYVLERRDRAAEPQAEPC